MDVKPVTVQPKPLKSLKNPLLQYLRTHVGLAPGSVLRSKMTVRSEQSAAKQNFFARLQKVAPEFPKTPPVPPLKDKVDAILNSDLARQPPHPTEPAVNQLIQQQLQQLQAQVKQLQNQQRQQKEQELQLKTKQILEKQQSQLPPIEPYQPEPFSPAELLRQPFQLHQLLQFQDIQQDIKYHNYQPQMMAALVGRSARSSAPALKVNVTVSEKPFANYSVPHDHGHSAAITTYSDFDRPSEGILLRNGYDPMLLHSSRPTNHRPDKKACREFEPERLRCEQFLDYRSLDGICNNLREPHWGNASEAYSRVTFPTYADAPVLQARGQQPDCCAVNRGCTMSECFQFSVPPFDPFYSQFNVTCHQFARSLPSRKARCHTNGMREQFSTVTHWLDGSQIYGSSIPQSLRIRSFLDGQLTFRDIVDGSTNEPYTDIFNQLLPSIPSSFTSSCKAAGGHRTCFLAGDDRVNQTPMLSTIHTIFVRYHNLVARQMSQHFTNWNDEEVFQETKKFVTAVYQVVVYKELLPVLLGSSILEPGHPLRLLDNGHFEEYDDTFNPHVLNEFTSAAFRCVHKKIIQNIKPPWL
ncbi:hypothetical protein RvY_04223 [Ramazzottius varieornatus]|uniref:Uncharacterized protein n=1 Tax=Ramazzottius varieornatus TaxID=947166 RepID=A0A1D1UQY5_RAMVA|nr:hypothetical protein RvY_04223 [Ramazzottius varieornatus]